MVFISSPFAGITPGTISEGHINNGGSLYNPRGRDRLPKIQLRAMVPWDKMLFVARTGRRVAVVARARAIHFAASTVRYREPIALIQDIRVCDYFALGWLRIDALQCKQRVVAVSLNNCRLIILLDDCHYRISCFLVSPAVRHRLARSINRGHIVSRKVAMST